MTLVSSVNNIIFKGSFSYIQTYIINNRGPIIDPWGTPCFNTPQTEKKF